MIPRRLYLSKEQLKWLHFKPTISSLLLSEGHEAKINCSIDIPDTGLEHTIVWKKDEEDLPLRVHVNELKTTTDGVTTLLSTVMYVSFKGDVYFFFKVNDSRIQRVMNPYVLRFSFNQVQREDAGVYLCTLSINSEMKRSRPITVEVEGEFIKILTPEYLLLMFALSFLYFVLAFSRSANIHAAARGLERYTKRFFLAVVSSRRTS